MRKFYLFCRKYYLIILIVAFAVSVGMFFMPYSSYRYYNAEFSGQITSSHSFPCNPISSSNALSFFMMTLHLLYLVSFVILIAFLIIKPNMRKSKLPFLLPLFSFFLFSFNLVVEYIYRQNGLEQLQNITNMSKLTFSIKPHIAFYLSLLLFLFFGLLLIMSFICKDTVAMCIPTFLNKFEHKPKAKISNASLSTELTNLSQLHDEGKLTDEEYAAAKTKLLN